MRFWKMEMKIAWLWVATMAWLFGLPALIPAHAALAIDLDVVRFASAATVVLVAVPRLHRLEWAPLLLFVLGLVAGVRALWGEGLGGSPGADLFAFAYVGVASLLAVGLGRRLMLFDEALEALAVGPDDQRAEPFEERQQEAYREIRRARRHERPLALIALSASGVEPPPPAASRVVREVQRDVTHRYANAQIAKLLLHETDGTALILRRRDHFILLLPETEADGARHAAKRLAEAASERLGVELRCGIASFPDQEVTLEGLLGRAESELEAAELAPSARREKEGRGRRRDLRVAEPARLGEHRGIASTLAERLGG